MQKQGQITTVLEEILVDLRYHIAGLAWLIQDYLVLVKKIKKNQDQHSKLSRSRTLSHHSFT